MKYTVGCLVKGTICDISEDFLYIKILTETCAEYAVLSNSGFSKCPALGDEITGLVDSIDKISNKMIYKLVRDNSFICTVLKNKCTEFSDGNLSINKVARINGYKTNIVVVNNNNIDLKDFICSSLVSAKSYIGEIINIIEFTEDRDEFICRCVRPLKYIKYVESDDGIKFIVSKEHAGSFIGRRGYNIKLLTQLLDSPIEIEIDEN
jgi:transcription antitermination factor NusA-like protein